MANRYLCPECGNKNNSRDGLPCLCESCQRMTDADEAALAAEPARHACETCGTSTWANRRWCGPGCEQIAAMQSARKPCNSCQSLGPNPECATIERPTAQRELAFAPMSRFSAHQFDLAALEDASRVIASVYASTCAAMSRNWVPTAEERHESPAMIAAEKAAIEDYRAGRIMKNEQGVGWHPAERDLVPFVLQEVPYARARLVEEETLARGWIPHGLWQYLLLGRWQPNMPQKEVLREVLRKRGRAA